MSIDNTPLLQQQSDDFEQVIDFLEDVWRLHNNEAQQDPVVPIDFVKLYGKIFAEEAPKNGRAISSLKEELKELLSTYTVKTSHPMFLGYVTPPSLDVAALADAISAKYNQNVSFANLSPLGAALEMQSVRWLGEIVGYNQPSSGVLTSGGSAANLYALSTAIRHLLGENYRQNGYSGKKMRVYCSTETHQSIDKAAVFLGLGTNSILKIPVDENHRMDTKLLNQAIEKDLENEDYIPLAIIGNAGTRRCCAFDNLRLLSNVAKKHSVWFHVDGAYGAFLRQSSSAPKQLKYLHEADSITIDPHKLLFTPFDCGALLVKTPEVLSQNFGSEGEYIETQPSSGLLNYADYGMQLGRSMKALKVWLVLKRFGLESFSKEYDRLISLRANLEEKIRKSEELEVLGPVDGIAICFRWVGTKKHSKQYLNRMNSRIRNELIGSGKVFVDEIEVDECRGFRVCFTNFRTQLSNVESLVEIIINTAKV